MAIKYTSTIFGGLFVALCCVLVFGQEPLPFLAEIPQTSFTCANLNYGYYADKEANCQAFHVCLNGQKWSFLCPNQTVFNQHYLVCDYPTNVDCQGSDQFFALNERIGQQVNFLP
ncbi:hypothetical protein CHUAL_013005 [Chamberlinius hualienensis]